jgi:hypothetical protein
MIAPFAKKMNMAEVLIWYDGPVLAHYTAHDAQYIVTWSDQTDTQQIWHAIEVSSPNVKLYKDNKISLIEVMRRSRGIFRCINDFIDQHGTARGELVKLSDIDPSILPTEESYLEPPDDKV